MDKLELTKVYGTLDNPINIDTIFNEIGYIYRIFVSGGVYGTLPDTVNSFLLMGFSSVYNDGAVIYGVQIAFGFDGCIAIRNAYYAAAGTSWSTWRYIYGQ